MPRPRGAAQLRRLPPAERWQLGALATVATLPLALWCSPSTREQCLSETAKPLIWAQPSSPPWGWPPSCCRVRAPFLRSACLCRQPSLPAQPAALQPAPCCSRGIFISPESETSDKHSLSQASGWNWYVLCSWITVFQFSSVLPTQLRIVLTGSPSSALLSGHPYLPHRF